MSPTPTVAVARPAAALDLEVRAAVAAVAAVHLEETLAGRRDVTARSEVAGSRWLSPRLAARLAGSRSVEIKMALAGNRSCPPAVLDRLAATGAPMVRAAAVRNPACPYPIVVAHGDPENQLAHPDCPTETLVAAATVTGRRGPRNPVLRHPRLPADVRATLIDQLHWSSDLWTLLENPSLTHTEAERILAARADESHQSVGRWKWAENPNADPGWLARTAEETFASNDQGTIAHVARNPTTPPDVLARIVAGHAHRDIALANPSCPLEALLAEALRTPQTDPRVTDYGYTFRAREIATNPAATAAVLRHLTGQLIAAGDCRYRFTLTHARTAGQASTVLALLDGWTGSLADLLATADAATLPTC